MVFRAWEAFKILSLNNLSNSTKTAGNVLIVNVCSHSNNFIKMIRPSLALTISVNKCLTSWRFFLCQELGVFQNILVLLLLLKLSLALAFISLFSCPRLPYLDYAAVWLSQLFCMQVALAWFFLEERERERSCWGYWERITASHGDEE